MNKDRASNENWNKTAFEIHCKLTDCSINKEDLDEYGHEWNSSHCKVLVVVIVVSSNVFWLIQMSQ